MPPRLDLQAISRQLLDPADPRLRALLAKRPIRSTIAIARCWLLIAGAFALAAWQPGPLTWAIAFVVIGTQQYALSVLSHDAKHRTLYRSIPLNDAVGLWLTSAPLGTDFIRERTVHLDHHRRLGDDDDPDRDLYRASDKADVPAFLLYLSGLSTLPGVRRRPTAQRQTTLQSRIAALLRSRAHAIPAQIVIFGIFALVLEWWLYFPLWIAPLFFLMLIPQRIRQFCEHAQAVLPDHAGDSGRLVTYRANAIERIFLAPFHMDHHAEHHIWATVPCFALPALAAIIPENGLIDRRGSYVAFLREYFRRLPLPSTEAAAA